MILRPTFIILISIVFILVWLFVRTIDHRKWLTLLVSLALTPIAYFYVFYPLINIFTSYHHEKYFDENSWKEQPELRYEMLNHILSNQLFVNSEKDSIKTVLGKADWLGWDEATNSKSENKWNYNLGFKPGAFNDKQECLELIFKNNKVTQLKTYQLEKDFE
ncbi:hypothetical protein KFZ70_15665 [Tamlana fucoidanivorans]|uniref:Uncharacterized protein n=1 Tax=Allotamlana fucoidanivorans TaxID=2583814 RepID=A0A5C4SCG2_9FLAO|nr:hypothetical protein [Tamlana fucoidanivorans]TNJ41210.1 hypothetical protein FGF67_16350 [Tamlana fucoidanivorans]